VGAILNVPKGRKLVAQVRSGVLADHTLAFVHGEHGAQHSLILCVWLAKIQVGHNGHHRQEFEKVE